MSDEYTTSDVKRLKLDSKSDDHAGNSFKVKSYVEGNKGNKETKVTGMEVMDCLESRVTMEPPYPRWEDKDWHTYISPESYVTEGDHVSLKQVKKFIPDTIDWEDSWVTSLDAVCTIEQMRGLLKPLSEYVSTEVDGDQISGSELKLTFANLGQRINTLEKFHWALTSNSEDFLRNLSKASRDETLYETVSDIVSRGTKDLGQCKEEMCMSSIKHASVQFKVVNSELSQSDARVMGPSPTWPRLRKCRHFAAILAAHTINKCNWYAKMIDDVKASLLDQTLELQLRQLQIGILDQNLHQRRWELLYVKKEMDQLIHELLATPRSGDMVSDRGWNLLMSRSASQCRSVTECAIAHLLLSQCFGVSRPSDVNYTVLHLAAQNGQDKLVEILLEYYPALNLDAHQKCVGKDGSNAGWTPLMLACRGCEMKHVATAKLLLQNGCDPNIPKADGVRAINIAATTGSKEMVELMLEHCTIYPTQSHPHPIIQAIKCVNTATVSPLLKHLRKYPQMLPAVLTFLNKKKQTSKNEQFLVNVKADISLISGPSGYSSALRPAPVLAYGQTHSDNTM